MIHFVHFYARPAGIEVLLPEIINYMSNYNFSVFIIRPPLKNTSNVYANTSIPVTTGSKKNVKAFLLFWKYAHKNRKDIFHVYNIGPFFLLILRLAGVKKIIYAIHGTKYWNSFFQRIIRKTFWKLALTKNIKIISNSEYSRSVFLQTIQCNNNIEVNYNPINMDKFIYKPKIKKSNLNISYVGRIDKGKNLKKWLEIASKISLIYPKVTFNFFGKGSQEEELKEFTNKLGLENKVFFNGLTINIEKAYWETNVLLFLSEYESFGNVVVESILCGTPVIASAIPSLIEIFQNYPDFLVPLDANLEKNIINKLNNLDQLIELLPSVNNEFRKRFSLEQHSSQLETLYASF